MARGLKFKKNRKCIIYVYSKIIKSSDQRQNNWSTGQMIFTFVLAYAKGSFSHNAAHIVNPTQLNSIPSHEINLENGLQYKNNT